MQADDASAWQILAREIPRKLLQNSEQHADVCRNISRLMEGMHGINADPKWMLKCSYTCIRCTCDSRCGVQAMVAPELSSRVAVRRRETSSNHTEAKAAFCKVRWKCGQKKRWFMHSHSSNLRFMLYAMAAIHSADTKQQCFSQGTECVGVPQQTTFKTRTAFGAPCLANEIVFLIADSYHWLSNRSAFQPLFGLSGKSWQLHV